MRSVGIAQLKTETRAGALEAEVHVQVAEVTERVTREGKPFLVVQLCDATDQMSLRAWHDHPQFEELKSQFAGAFVAIAGEFSQSSPFGLEARGWKVRLLTAEEHANLMAGGEELRARQDACFQSIQSFVGEIADPRLLAVANMFLEEFGQRLRRTAAARNFHHARRGGLVEHVATMLKAAAKICEAYEQLNRDLLLCGVLLHDAGKLWENHIPEAGFVMPYDERAELLGHIVIGIELTNTLWRKATEKHAPEWQNLEPASEDVRLHLLHLVASHHGELEYGSPIVPKTPEAVALHYLDNLDAKLEMFATGYQNGTNLAPRIFERVKPLPGNLVEQLGKFKAVPKPAD